jgi:hypothetical protein
MAAEAHVYTSTPPIHRKGIVTPSERIRDYALWAKRNI